VLYGASEVDGAHEGQEGASLAAGEDLDVGGRGGDGVVDELCGRDGTGFIV
jgi:hypothetical protein